MAFEHVSTTKWIKGEVRKETAWKIITDFSNWADLIDLVDKVEVMEFDGEEGVSRWEVTVDGAPLYWIEKDYFNRPAFEFSFTSIDGDFDNINGRWRVTDGEKEGIVIHFEIDYNLGIPVIEENLGPIFREKMMKSITSMVDAVARQAKESVSEDRRHKRYKIGALQEIYMNGRLYTVKVIDISQQGIRFNCDNLAEKPLILEIGDKAFEVEQIELSNDTYRVLFKNPVPEEKLAQVARAMLSSYVTTGARTAESEAVYTNK
ncbi:MAG: hypothetical protein GF398_21915 [Chitinivibrionales bacterium]|nr:hypothetical protein [Chitinivibrionales bacterium]